MIKVIFWRARLEHLAGVHDEQALREVGAEAMSWVM